jgi:hypothetical protein
LTMRSGAANRTSAGGMECPAPSVVKVTDLRVANRRSSW